MVGQLKVASCPLSTCDPSRMMSGDFVPGAAKTIVVDSPLGHMIASGG